MRDYGFTENHNIITPAARKMVYLQAFNLILHLRLVWHSENAVISRNAVVQSESY